MTRRDLLFVHPAAELYGSDRALLSLLAGLDRTRFAPTVAVPCEGPLLERLAGLDVPTRVMPVGRIERASLRPFQLARLPLGAVAALRALDEAFGQARLDLVHTNTLAVLGGALWAKLRGIPHVWHAHEIVREPVLAAKALTGAVSLLATRVVCNSEATRQWLLDHQPRLIERARVAPNGVRRPEPDPARARALRAELGVSEQGLLVAQVGRISARKAPTLLVEAAERAGIEGAHYLFAGDAPPGQEGARRALEDRISDSPLLGALHLRGFREDVWSVWDGCDVAVVPSVRPESFGLVALEAGLAGKPVIVTATGNLPELIRDGETGLVVPPGDATALAAALRRLAGDSALRERLGAAARARAETFTPERTVRAVEAVYEEVLG